MTRTTTFIVLSLFLTMTARAEQADEEVLARVGDAVVTQDMMDAAFSRIDEAMRLTFIRDGKRVDSMVKNMLAMQALAIDARAEGFDEEPLVGQRLKLAEDKELAEAWLDELVRRAPPADFEQLAREHYQINKPQFKTSASWDLSHILVGFEDREEEEALELAQALHRRLTEESADFEELVRQYSDDPSAASNRGHFTKVERGDMVKPFEDAALALENTGDISAPVRTRFGYHLIRLDGKNAPRQLEFEEVRKNLVGQFEQKHRQDLRRQFVEDAVSQAPLEVPEGAVERMLKRYFGEELEKAPIFSK